MIKSPQQIIAELEALQQNSPYRELLNHPNLKTRNSAESAELGRQGAYALILMKLKHDLLGEGVAL